jgi:hypothetical protein
MRVSIMLEIMDFSSRRGGLVPLLPKIHAMLTENAAKDVLAGYRQPENIILWKQKAYKELVETHRRFLLVTDVQSVAGLLFYHFNDSAAYIDELQTAWQYRGNTAVFNLLADKFAANKDVKACTQIFAGENIKSPADKELLASVGFKETFPGGWEPLGSLPEAVNALRLRYQRS